MSSKKFGHASQTILKNVNRAMQDAEEIHGPDGEEYIALMEAIAGEAMRRALRYASGRAFGSKPVPAKKCGCRKSSLA